MSEMVSERVRWQFPSKVLGKVDSLPCKAVDYLFLCLLLQNGVGIG